LAFGQVQGVPLIGLPGNPVAAMVSFEQFVRPCILRMLGKTHLHKPVVKAILTETVTTGGWRSFKRVIVERQNGHHYATVARPHGSSNLTSMSRANGLAVISEGVSRVEAGQEVEVQMLDWPEETSL
jgi:molybdopterin molybdotransferase